MTQFWNNVNRKPGHGPNGDCWVWIGAIAKGYGRFRMDGIRYYAHRISWKLINGSIPNNLQVLHKCDNRCCVNPDHLFLGTQLDNIKDMFNKGRRDMSEECSGNHKLTQIQVDKLRVLRTKGWSVEQLSLKFDLSKSQVRNIYSRRSWS